MKKFLDGFSAVSEKEMIMVNGGEDNLNAKLGLAGFKFEEKSIKSLKKDLQILNQTLEDQKNILNEYALLYKHNKITKLKLLEERQYYSSQQLIFTKKYKDLIDILINF